MSEELRDAEGWLQHPDFKDITILDPDGWDRTNLKVSWAERITYEVFKRRLFVSTVNGRLHN